MFFDEDGDLAHEFYVEVKEGRKSKMKRVYENLKPQVSNFQIYVIYLFVSVI